MCLLLAFYSLSVLSVNFVGVALILLGLALLVADLFLTSHGVLTVGGIIAFVVGSIMLTSGAEPGMRVAWHVIAAMTTAVAGFFLLIVTLGLRAQRRKVATGAEGLIGSVGEARSALDPRGSVFVAGELWRARAEGEAIQPNEEVIVTGVHGLTLKVKRRQEV
jgi:membrane-bound serine protease (ClpP class)